MLRRIKSIFTTRRSDQAVDAAGVRFQIATDDFGAAYRRSSGMTEHARLRYRALLANGDAGDAPAEVTRQARGHESGDLRRYSREELGSHSAAIDDLAMAFDAVEAAFSTIDSRDALHRPAAALYEAITAQYQLACDGYACAARCAMYDALDGELDGMKAEWQSMLKSAGSSGGETSDGDHQDGPDLRGADAADDGAPVRSLRQAAAAAEARADDLCSGARVAALIAKTTADAYR